MSIKPKNKMHSLSIASTITLILSIVFLLATALSAFIGLILVVFIIMAGGNSDSNQIQLFSIIVVLGILFIIFFVSSILLSIIALLKKDVNKFSKNTALICLIISLCIIAFFILSAILN